MVLVANHVDVIDPFVLAAAYTSYSPGRRPLRFGAKAEYFTGGGIDDNGKFGRSLRTLMHATRQIPVDRGNGPEAMQGLLDGSRAAIERGDSVGLHPEGTLGGQPGKLSKFRTGAALVACHEGVPLLPTGIIYHSSSNSQKRHVEVQFGDPITPPYKIDGEIDRHDMAAANKLTREAEKQVALLARLGRTNKFAVRGQRRQTMQEYS